MFSLKKLFSNDRKFYDLLESSSQEAQNSVHILVQLIQATETGSSEKQIMDLALSRLKDKQITEEISELLCKSFVTPMEREDIDILCHTLYRIPKNVFKIAQRLSIYPIEFRRNDIIKKQVGLLEQAINTLHQMVQLLRTKPDLKQISELNTRLKFFEGESDKNTFELYKIFYQEEHDLKNALAIQELGDLLERITDYCRDAGNVVFQTVMKYM
jgi:uncharacterized protein Yka (UPF0111/DUF47 family)